jgi:hypothetical protein
VPDVPLHDETVHVDAYLGPDRQRLVCEGLQAGVRHFHDHGGDWLLTSGQMHPDFGSLKDSARFPAAVGSLSSLRVIRASRGMYSYRHSRSVGLKSVT